MAFVVMIDNNEYIFIRKRSKERKKIATTTITFISLVCILQLHNVLIANTNQRRRMAFVF